MEDSRLCRSGLALCAAIILLPLLASCNQGWVGDARLVNKKNDSQYVSTIKLDEETADGIDPFTHDTSSCNGCAENWNKIGYQFDGNMFDSSDLVLYKVSFDANNTPEYAFGYRAAGWDLSYWTTREYTYDASDEGNTTSLIGSIGITPLAVYQYRGMNPLVSPTSGYNTGTRMERFRFHRIVGKVGGSIPLDQFVLAVDTYSKFAFVYGYITETNSMSIPTAYEPVELHGTGEDEGRPFYEYDPIGYVEEDGEVVLYERYKQDMIDASSVDYMPKVHSTEATMAQRNSAGNADDDIGRSPYYPGLYESGHGGS